MADNLQWLIFRKLILLLHCLAFGIKCHSCNLHLTAEFSATTMVWIPWHWSVWLLSFQCCSNLQPIKYNRGQDHRYKNAIAGHIQYSRYLENWYLEADLDLEASDFWKGNFLEPKESGFREQSGFRDRGCRHGSCSLNPDSAVFKKIKIFTRYFEEKLEKSRLVVCKTRFYLFCYQWKWKIKKQNAVVFL